MDASMPHAKFRAPPGLSRNGKRTNIADGFNEGKAVSHALNEYMGNKESCRLATASVSAPRSDGDRGPGPSSWQDVTGVIPEPCAPPATEYYTGRAVGYSFHNRWGLTDFEAEEAPPAAVQRIPWKQLRLITEFEAPYSFSTWESLQEVAEVLQWQEIPELGVPAAAEAKTRRQ
jgi:hypothetical protein